MSTIRRAKAYLSKVIRSMSLAKCPQEVKKQNSEIFWTSSGYHPLFFLAGNSLDIIISQFIDVAARLTNYAEWMDSNANFERTRATGQQRDEGGKEIGRPERAPPKFF